MQVKIETRYFSDGEKTLKLKDYKNVWVDYVDGDKFQEWEVDETNTHSGIYATGRTLDEVYADYEECFIFLWETYAKEADEKMTKNAQQLKQWLLSVVESEVTRG